MRQFLASILMPFLLFCTSVPPASAPPDYLITEVTLTCGTSSRTYADQQTMGRILQFLRSVPHHGMADQDSIPPGLPLYTLRLTHLSGRVTEYRQLGRAYLAKEDEGWYCIDPEQDVSLEDFIASD